MNTTTKKSNASSVHPRKDAVTACAWPDPESPGTPLSRPLVINDPSHRSSTTRCPTNPRIPRAARGILILLGGPGFRVHVRTGVLAYAAPAFRRACACIYNVGLKADATKASPKRVLTQTFQRGRNDSFWNRI